MMLSCYRCGREFEAIRKALVCDGCRKQPPRELSLRERQVVDLLRQAHANKEIASRLHLSEGTIKEYLNRIFRKTGAQNRTELALRAASGEFDVQESVPEPGALPDHL